MAKKKASTPGSPIGYVGAAVVGSEPTPVRDNNPDGPSNLPNHEFYAYRRDDLYGKRICFPNDIGRGESLAGGDVTVNTADGVSHSKGKGKPRYNYGDQQSGKWGDNEFDGGDMSGM